MRDFNFKAEYQKLLTPEVVAYLTQIHEYKGQQNLFIEAKTDPCQNNEASLFGQNDCAPVL